MIKNLKNTRKTSNGITLIALVITIIVLLILAGISISMLSGDNGILQKATDAKKHTDKAGTKEQIELTILGAMNTDTTMDKDKFKVGIEALGGTVTGDDFPLTVTLNGFNFDVDGNGNVTDLKPIVATAIQLDRTTDSVGVDDTITLTATLTPQNSSATITWILDEGGSYATLNTSTGEVTGTQEGANKVRIKAKAINPDGTEIESSNVCIITITASPYIDYSYVEYPVEYTDVYTGTTYHKDTAWRLVTKLGANEVTSSNVNTEQILTNANVNIISTGIPAKLYYYSGTINTRLGRDGYNIWKGSDEDVTKYTNPVEQGGAGLYGSSYNSNSNMRASAGLYYNFEDILYNVQSSTLSTSTIGKNNGGFIWIKNGNSEISAGNSTYGSNLFRVESLNSGSVDNIREANLEDIKDVKTEDRDQITSSTDKRPGLFRLDQYTKDSINHDSSWYMLASPCSWNTNNVHVVSFGGTIGDDSEGVYGVRPLVSLSGVTLKREAGSHVWKIVEAGN